MDYEKKYKEVLEKARQLCAYPTTKPFISDLQDLFPELKESEDERIRGAIIDHLKDNNLTEWAAWLEKQESEPNWCHHKVDLSNCSEEYRKAYYDGWNNCNMQHSQCELEKSDVLKCLINGMKFYYENNEEATWGTLKFSMKVKDILSWLEKQCLKSNPYSGVSFNYNGNTWGMCARDNGVDILFNKKLIQHISDEKQGENCLVNFDEAEKEKYDFVSGQYIECRASFNEFKEDNSYWLEYIGDDNYIGRSDNILNQKFHITPRQLFTLFTWQHRPKEDNNVNEETNAPTGYGKYVDECLNEASKHFFSNGEDKYSVADLFYAGVRCGKSWFEKQAEQKSDSFCKEHCKGYQETGKCFADGECKAKREAEQKSAWSEEEEHYIRQLESMVREKWALSEKAQDEDVIKNMSDLAFFLKTLNPNKKPSDEEMKTILRTEYEKGRADAIAEIQNRWSEEDEETLGWLCTFLKEYGHKFYEGNEENVIDWLKSLKGRVQPKQEWSEEEIDKAAQEWDSKASFNPFYMTMDGDKPTGIKQDITTHKESFKAGVNWILKSLRPQNNITDEELAQAKKDAYNDALDKIEYHSGEPTFDDGWSAAIWYLKKRNIQPQPKQECGEEDEDYINDLIKHFSQNERLKNTKEDIVIWLKSLRPQNKWKPSDEQIEALHTYIYNPQYFNSPDPRMELVESVYKDLKKLKDEQV